MHKCEKCGLEGDSTQIRQCPDEITYWAKKPICRQCYLELKKVEQNKISEDKSTFKDSSEKIVINRMENKMNKKSMIIYLLVSLWIVIGILFICVVFQRTSDYLDFIDSFRDFGDSDRITNAMTFYHVLFIILFIIIFTLSFLLAYCTFIKKSQSWLIGIMFSSFLIYFVFQAIYFTGWIIISGKFDQFFNSLEYIAYMFMLFIVPSVIVILTRPEVKSYFGKT